MGVLFFFDKEVPAIVKNSRADSCQIEVADNHGVPELRVGPPSAAYEGTIAIFKEWEQFEEFVEAINNLKNRLEPVRK